MIDPVQSVNWVKVSACIAAGFCMGIGTIGPSLGQGMIGAKACESLGKRPESYSLIQKALIISLSIVEASAIYALLISLILLFVIAK